MFYAYHLFNNAFRYLHMGYAASMAWVLFLIVFALLFVPRLERLTVELPIPIPNSVVVLLLPTTLRFFIELPLAEFGDAVCSHTTAPVVLVLVSEMVMLRSVPVPPLEPSMVTFEVPFRRMKPPVGAVVLVIRRGVAGEAPVG